MNVKIAGVSVIKRRKYRIFGAKAHMTLTQLFTSDDVVPTESLVEPIKNREFWTKPLGGLWTSSLVGSRHSAWTDWCDREDFRQNTYRFRLKVSPTANVFEVKTPEDVDFLIRLFGEADKCGMMIEYRLDWEKVSQFYDGVRLSYQMVRKTGGYESPFHAWDVESTLWFRWCFTDVTEI